jgi:uncharacterized protein
MNMANFYLFKNNQNEEFIYSGLTNLIIESNDRVKRVLNERMYDEEAAKLLLGEAESEADQSFEKRVVDRLVLFVTNQCNLACSYCFEKANRLKDIHPMDLETLKNTLTYFLGNFDHPGVVRICFFGGEPLLNMPLLKNSIALFNDIAGKYPVRFRFGLATNGTVLNDDILDFIVANDIKVQVGMDGLETAHNLHRKFSDGRDTYQTVAANVQKLAKYCEVSARITLTDFNMDWIKTCLELEEIGFAEVKMEYVSDGNFHDRLSLERFSANLRSFADWFIVSIQRKKLINFALFMNYLKKIHLGSHYNRFPCQAGVSQYTVATDGSIYLCHRFNNCSGHQCGDIYRGLDNEKRLTFLHEHQKRNRFNHKCRNCWAQSLCGGTCYHASFTHNGDTRPISDFDCEYRKLVLAQVLYVYASLTEREKLFIKNMKRL